ncbi:MAG: 50S ribosomal protein L25 [Bacteroidota bacterium]|nr:50S ribosomal protein L25 [Bacteroidota bacterium]
MREFILEAEVRTQFGKHSRAIRRNGNIPGIFYLHGEDAIPITVTEKNLKPLVYTPETHIVNLRLNNGAEKNCILRDVQFDPVTDRPIHFDLQGLRENETITMEVPITIVGGTPIGVREGGILQQLIHRLKISCLPKYIPEHIEINVENLKINNFTHVSDLKIENVTILESESTSIVGILPPITEKEPTPAVTGAEETIEPEVIGKGKKVEEGAEVEGEKKAEAGTKSASPAKEEKK